MGKTGSRRTNDLSGLNDKDLVSLVLNNREGAFTVIVNRHKEGLLNFISSYTSIKQDSEDICQESFDRAYRSLSKYDPKYAFTTWLYNIAKNAAIDHLRRTKTNMAHPSVTENENELLRSADISDSPEDDMIKTQTMTEIYTNIQKLSPTYREVAELRFIKEYAYEEIARELNIPINTVRTRIKRAKQMLKSNISK